MSIGGRFEAKESPVDFNYRCCPRASFSCLIAGLALDELSSHLNVTPAVKNCLVDIGKPAERDSSAGAGKLQGFKVIAPLDKH